MSNCTSVIKDICLKLTPFKVIVTDTDRSATYDFLLTFHGNHDAITVSEINTNKVENRNFSHSRVFCVPAEVVPLGIGSAGF